MTDERLSNCCGAPALNEIADDGFAMCSECHDHAEFPPTCEKCESEMIRTNNQNYTCPDCGHTQAP